MTELSRYWHNIGEYIVFYQVGPIDHFIHFPGPFAQSSGESEYNGTCTEVMAL